MVGLIAAIILGVIDTALKRGVGQGKENIGVGLTECESITRFTPESSFD